MWAIFVLERPQADRIVDVQNDIAEKDYERDLRTDEQGNHLLDMVLELEAMIPVHLLHVRENSRIIIG